MSTTCGLSLSAFRPAGNLEPTSPRLRQSNTATGGPLKSWTTTTGSTLRARTRVLQRLTDSAAITVRHLSSTRQTPSSRPRSTRSREPLLLRMFRVSLHPSLSWTEQSPRTLVSTFPALTLKHGPRTAATASSGALLTTTQSSRATTRLNGLPATA